MQMDFYSKAVMTVIAVALAVLAVGQFSPGPAVAQGGSCGTSRSNSCYFEITGGYVTVDGQVEVTGGDTCFVGRDSTRVSCFQVYSWN